AGTEEALTNTIKVYPNPAKGQININLGTNLQNITKIVVVDLSGRVIVQMNIGKMQTLAIPSGRLKAGTYMIRMLGDKTQSQKIVVL
ncbi:MAG TPA: T9SS type A sorting domain-containing protein, partial [Chitinophagaceae bacterium]|nr:T9SS type A sorting domain-containing protein [Chitinophagaceae bacterium]